MTKHFGGSHLSIRMVEGKDAPRINHPGSPRHEPSGITVKNDLVVLECVVTEKGTEGNLPMVDFFLEDPDTKEVYVFTTTGRIINALSAAIRGANVRNHGREEP